jgi:hypothetical protein
MNRSMKFLIPFLVLGTSCAGPALLGQTAWPPLDEPTTAITTMRAAEQGPLTAVAEPGAATRTPSAAQEPTGIDLGDEAQSVLTPAAVPPSQNALYAWDGGVVDGPDPGTVVEGGLPNHGLEPSASGRMHILELYQQRIDERDALAQEVEDMRALLAATEARLTAEVQAREAAESREQVLTQRVDALEAESRDLAGRLVTAQIRRLESEKLLLQTQIAAERTRIGGAGAGVQTAANSTKDGQ